MKTKYLGNTTEKIPAIGIGTWEMQKSKESEEAIKYTVQNGGSLIDTAEIYGTEDLVGRSIKGIDRKSVFIVSKVWTNHLAHDACIKACDESLKRLGTSYIDLYLVHWPSDSIEQFEEAQASLKKNELVANEIKLSVVSKQQAMEFVDYAKKNKITVLAYSPLERGIGNIMRNQQVYSKLIELASKYNKTPAQIALNWVIAHDPAVAIPKASRLEHAKENLEAADFSLSDDEVKELDAIS